MISLRSTPEVITAANNSSLVAVHQEPILTAFARPLHIDPRMPLGRQTPGERETVDFHRDSTPSATTLVWNLEHVHSAKSLVPSQNQLVHIDQLAAIVPVDSIDNPIIRPPTVATA